MDSMYARWCHSTIAEQDDVMTTFLVRQTAEIKTSLIESAIDAPRATPQE